jgi:hypothetical protein
MPALVAFLIIWEQRDAMIRLDRLNYDMAEKGLATRRSSARPGEVEDRLKPLLLNETKYVEIKKRQLSHICRQSQVILGGRPRGL